MTAETTDVQVVGTDGSSRFLLPDCFYGIASRSIKTLSLYGLIVQGNSMFPDPLVRLANTMEATTNSVFIVTHSSLVTDTGSRLPAVDWDGLSFLTSSLNTLDLSNTYLGASTTIPTFNNTIGVLSLANTGLSGTLPSTLFGSGGAPQPVQLSIDLQGNARLSGPLPGTFMDNVDFSTLTSFALNLRDCNISGSIPSAFLARPFEAGTLVDIDFYNNRLEGPLNNLFSSASFNPSTLKILSFDGGYNNFGGSLPTWLSGNSWKLTTFTFDCISCGLNGVISESFFYVMGDGGKLDASLDYNQLSGSFPRLFFDESPAEVTITLSHNSLESLPFYLFESTNFSTTTSLTIDLTSNKLTGDLPSRAGQFAASTSIAYSLILTDNPTLNGTIPASFLATFDNIVSEESASLNLQASNTKLTGVLALPSYGSVVGLPLTITADNANFTSLTYPQGPSTSSRLVTLSLSNNVHLTGQIRPALFTQNPQLAYLVASSTQLNGTFPILTTYPANLKVLRLAETAIDFCSGSRTAWSSSVLTSCLLPSQAQNCSTFYPSACLYRPSLAPTGCSRATQPTSEWTCVNGAWTFVGSVSSTVITIPAGSTTTNIQGNLTSTTVVINGLNSVLIIDGCADNVTITIELTPDDLKTIGGGGKLQTLLSLANASSCTSSVNATAIDTRVKGSSCRKVSVKKQSSSDGTLSGLFTVDKSACNRWWIILVSVIGGIVILVIIVILLVLFAPPIRQAIRPYSKKRPAASQGPN